MSQLDSLFNPKNVVVFGVSPTRASGGNKILHELHEGGFEGPVYAIGRSEGEFEGTKIYASIKDLPEVPDLVFSAVGISRTPQALIDAAEAGARNAIVFTAGFAEMSLDGAETQRQMVKDVNERGMRVVGPNCMGIFHAKNSLNLTDLNGIPKGSIGLISQSGNIAHTLIDAAPDYGMGIGAFVSVGNQADISMSEYVDYMADDPSIEVIVLYVESLQDGAGLSFVNSCRRAARKKPIVAIKGGVTNGGRRAAASHTARLSAPRDIYAAAFAQSGVIQVESLDHVLAVTEALLRCPTLKSDRIAVVGSGGGHSTIGADSVELAGLAVPQFEQHVVDFMSEHLPPWAPMLNPVDMTGGFTTDLTMFARLMEYPLSTDAFDGGLSYGLYGQGFVKDLVDANGLTWETAAPLLGTLQKKLGKPIVFYTPFARRSSPEFSAMRQAGIPCFGSLPEAGIALASLRTRALMTELPELAGEYSDLPDSSPELTAHADGTLTEVASAKLLEKVGIKSAPHRLISTAKEAVEAADGFGYPVVLKAQLKDVAHKSELGGVRLGLRNAGDVAAAFAEMETSFKDELAQEGSSLSVAKQISGDRELLVGVRKDAAFGHIAVVGIGGLLTEVAARTIILVAPFDEADFRRAIESSPLSDYFAEWRGNPAVDLDALYEIVRSTLKLCMANESIESVEINPLISSGQDLVAVDASIAVGGGTGD